MKRKFSEEQFFRVALFVGIITVLIALAFYAYLGIFSRYGSDDYCNTSFFLSGDLVSQMLYRYQYQTNRYSNILLIGLAEKTLGWYNVAILPSVMITLFVIGTYMFLDKVRQLRQVRLERSILFFLSVSVVFFSLLQAPNLFEVLYWRAGMATHFAPLVFMLFLGAFLLHQIGSSENRSLVGAVGPACFIGFFFVGGFSEPPAALMITTLLLAIVAVQFWGRNLSHRRIIALLLWSLAGVSVALILMAFSPSLSAYPEKVRPGFFEIAVRIIRFPLEFIVDTFRTVPLPTIVSMMIPAVLFFMKYVNDSPVSSQSDRRKLGIIMFVLPLIAYLLIAASFAPSAYGSSYPVGRARFAGRWIMTIALMTEGSLLGLWVTSLRTRFLEPVRFRVCATLILILLALYPLRAAWRVSAEVSTYQQRAAAWDSRDAEIRALKAQGVRDLVVRFLPQERIQDLGDHKGFRLNRCASIIYGVNSIVAVPMEDE